MIGYDVREPNLADGAASLQHSAVDDIAILVRNVGKMYYLYNRPQDRLKQAFLWGRKKLYREFWALRDVSFKVRWGEVIGIVGRNGAGKSTLLQILAGTLPPTTGEVQINGQVAALLQLGSGFNPQFTGRENVYLNGSVLGFSRKEIDERFDEIAAFADIGQFIDQPVKMYSSGMLIRLAFAVTINLDPDILLVDEALAVGDVFFRQKCYRRLETLRERGVSIILASHSMADVEQFCQRALLLDQGRVIFAGAAPETVKRYYLIEQRDRRPIRTASSKPYSSAQAVVTSDGEDSFWPSPEAFMDISGVAQVSNGWARCTGVAVCDSQGRPCRAFEQGDTATFFYEFELLRDIEIPIGGLVIRNEQGIHVHGKNTLQYGSEVPVGVVKGSRLRFRQDITLEIARGEYTFTIGLSTISSDDYEHRQEYVHSDLRTKTFRLCHLPDVGKFAVTFRQNFVPVQLVHYGVADLPGQCQVLVERLDKTDFKRRSIKNDRG